MNANPFFFGTMQGNRWQHPRLDVDRFLHNEVNYAEYLYWFHLYASVGLRRPDPTKLPGLPGQKTPYAQSPSPLNPTLSLCVPLSFEPGNYMTFNDIVSRNYQMSAIYSGFSTFTSKHFFRFFADFLSKLMPHRVSRSTAAHVFYAINTYHSVNDDAIGHLDSNGFMLYMKELVPQLAAPERCGMLNYIEIYIHTKPLFLSISLSLSVGDLYTSIPALPICNLTFEMPCLSGQNKSSVRTVGPATAF